MDYKPLISQAVKKTGWTRYKIAQELGYKRESQIYDVESGRCGMPGPKLIKLLQLAGKSFLFVILTSIGMTNTTITEAQAQVQPTINTSIHYAKWLYGRMQASWTRFWLTSVFA